MNKHEEKRLKIIENSSKNIEDLDYEDSKIFRKSLKEFKKEIKSKYVEEYSQYLRQDDIELVADAIVDAYDPSDGLSIELSTGFAMDKMMLKMLSEEYNRYDPFSEEAMNILMFVIDKYSDEFSTRYKNVGRGTVDNIIEDTFANYDGNTIFDVQVRKRIKKDLAGNR